jgi:predicted DCC family thiol-disulfide oxidoreductase YuxK
MFKGKDFGGPIFLYDGDCGFCNHTVRFLLRVDTQGRLRFARLQDERARSFIESRGLAKDGFSSAIFVADWSRRDECKVFTKSQVLVRALLACDGWARWVGRALQLLPKALLDFVYRLIAQRRHAISARLPRCPVPRANWRERFISLE